MVHRLEARRLETWRLTRYGYKASHFHSLTATQFRLFLCRGNGRTARMDHPLSMIREANLYLRNGLHDFDELSAALCAVWSPPDCESKAPSASSSGSWYSGCDASS